MKTYHFSILNSSAQNAIGWAWAKMWTKYLTHEVIVYGEFAHHVEHQSILTLSLRNLVDRVVNID